MEHPASPIHVHVHIEGLAELTQVLKQELHHLGTMLLHLGDRMADEAQNLTAAVQGIQTSFDSLNATLQTEMQAIADALSGAPTDQALRDAANDAVQRLGSLASQLDSMNTTVQGIIP